MSFSLSPDVRPSHSDDVRPHLAKAGDAGWLKRYARGLVVVDLVALLLAGLIAVVARFGSGRGELRGLSYYTVVLLLGLVWLAALALSRCYEHRFLGSGAEEFKRVGNASVRVTAVVALTAYAVRLEVARGFVAIVLPSGFVLLLLGRFLARTWLQRKRRRGEASHRVLVVGAHDAARDLVDQLWREPLAGLRVVGVCIPGGRDVLEPRDGPMVPVLGSIATVVPSLARCGADTVAVAAGPGINAEALRKLSYELEGTGVDLLVAPALTNVSGSRVHIRPVAGLPLLHLDEPELDGARKLVKALFDRGVALIALTFLAPTLIVLGLAVRLSSAGPAIFKQERVGRDGSTFGLWKYRSMVVDAEALRDGVGNDKDAVLFKARRDHRITPLGRHLRRFSLDELPQLVNVLRGDMSLVGPRPPLPSEVEAYVGHAHRRLLVKPGMTGLWQVSGRSELSWDETVRLDLRYVEDWSLALDLTVLAKTVVAVLRGRGAY